MFSGSQSHDFSCKHENHDLLTLASFNLFIIQFHVLSSVDRLDTQRLLFFQFDDRHTGIPLAELAQTKAFYMLISP